MFSLDFIPNHLCLKSDFPGLMELQQGEINHNLRVKRIFIKREIDKIHNFYTPTC